MLKFEVAFYALWSFATPLTEAISSNEMISTNALY